MLGYVNKNGRDGLYPVQAVANFFLDSADLEGTSCTFTKLILYSYIAYGWCLSALGIRLFPAKIEAWDHGVVIPDLYHEFKCWGGNPIGCNSTLYDVYTGHIQVPRIPIEDELYIKPLLSVWSRYKNIKTYEINELMMQEGTPWHKSYHQNKKMLDDDDIADYFTNGIIDRYIDRDDVGASSAGEKIRGII